MAKHWVKEELHKDWLAGRTEICLAWIKSHRDYAIGGAAAFAVAAVLAVSFVSRHRTLNEKAWEKLFIAQQFGYVSRVDDSRKLADEIINTYPRTSAAPYAAILKADLFYGEGKFKEAAAAYKQMAERGKPEILAPFAWAGLAASLQAGGDYVASITACQQFINRYPAHFLRPQIYLTMAMSQELAGQKVDAESTYKQLAAISPAGYYNQFAMSKLTPAK